MSRSAQVRASAAGTLAASKALRALADGDDQAALDALNGTADHATAVHAAAQLMATTRQAVALAVGGDDRKTADALRAGAAGLYRDAAANGLSIVRHTTGKAARPH